MDVLPERVALAEACGADAVVDAGEGDPVEGVRRFACGDGDEDDPRGGVDYVIETSGAAAARANIIPSLRRGGKAAIVGVGSDEKVINPSDIHGRAVTLLGSVVFPLGWGWDLARFIAVSGMSFEPAVTHRLPLDEAPRALQLADEGRCGKVIFLPHGEQAL